LLALLFEHLDERSADDAALALRVVDTGQVGEKAPVLREEGAGLAASRARNGLRRIP